MSELPKGWVTCQLGHLIDHIQAGKNVKCEERPPQDDEAGLVKISAVTWGKFNQEESKTLLESKENPEEKNRIKVGDLLISRANTLELVGAPVIVHAISKNLFLSDKVLRLDMDESLRPWALTCLRSQAGRKQIEAVATGNQLSMRNISQDAIRLLKFPLPPLAEQARIAQALDRLLAQVDTLKARLDALPALIKRFRQSVLSAAVSGQLTEEWQNDANIWGVSKIGSISTVATGKTPRRDNPEYWEGGDIPWVTSAATGNISCTAANEFLTKLAIDECLLKIFPPGTLLMAMYGEGKTRGQVTELKINASCNQACAAINVNEKKALKNFVRIVLQENYEETRKQAVGGAQPNLNLNKVKEIPIPLPSIEEQTEIVRRVEQLFAFADQLEARLADARARVDALTQSILAKAFRGELVPQDPADEPASVLLERITAQRAAAPKPKRGRKPA